jgi:hypothetical protein
MSGALGCYPERVIGVKLGAIGEVEFRELVQSLNQQRFARLGLIPRSAAKVFKSFLPIGAGGK